MTVQEAIKIIKNNVCVCCKEECESCAYGKAIESMEKQIPKKPILVKQENFKYYKCPSCGNPTLRPFCGDCGQKLDWKEGGTSD